MTTPSPYPLLLAPTLLSKVWGGRRLAAFNKPLPATESIGESWELADLSATSASGAGGQAVRSTIAAGPLQGRMLRDAVQMWESNLLGTLALTPAGEFPLLVKFLDASHDLSVQVHPSPAYAAAHQDAHLKHESWYVVEAHPGAMLYIGLRPGVSLSDFAQAARSQSASLPHLLNHVPAVPGECHTLPSGTVHALGAGVVVAEVQTPSDTTFRLYDWGRTASGAGGRALHIEQALESMADPTIAAPQRSALGAGELCGRIATTDHYTIDEARPQPGDEVSIGHACKSARSGPVVIVVLDGTGRINAADGSFASVPVHRGDTVLLPAAVAAAARLHAASAGIHPMRALRIGLCG